MQKAAMMGASRPMTMSETKWLTSIQCFLPKRSKYFPLGAGARCLCREPRKKLGERSKITDQSANAGSAPDVEIDATLLSQGDSGKHYRAHGCRSRHIEQQLHQIDNELR